MRLKWNIKRPCPLFPPGNSFPGEDDKKFSPRVVDGLTSERAAVFTWDRITFRKTFQNVIRPFPDLKA